VQVHPDDLPAVVCFRHRGPPCLVETDALQLPASARSGGPLLHRIRGRIKKKAGAATDDPDLEAEGRAKEAQGDLKQAGEKVKDAFKR